MTRSSSTYVILDALLELGVHEDLLLLWGHVLELLARLRRPITKGHRGRCHGQSQDGSGGHLVEIHGEGFARMNEVGLVKALLGTRSLGG